MFESGGENRKEGAEQGEGAGVFFDGERRRTVEDILDEFAASFFENRGKCPNRGTHTRPTFQGIQGAADGSRTGRYAIWGQDGGRRLWAPSANEALTMEKGG